MTLLQALIRPIVILVAVLVLIPASGQAPTSVAAPSPGLAAASPETGQLMTYQFGLLRKGPKWAPARGNELQGLQEAHLANIRRLAESGAMVAAGPIEAKGASDLRGIFVFKSASLEQARAFADSDPMIKIGRLKIDLLPLLVSTDIGAHYAEAKAKNGGQDQMLAYQLVLLKDGRNHAGSKVENDALALARQSWIQQLSNGKTLVLAGPLTSGEYSGLMVFRLDSPEAAMAVVQGDPAVKAERTAFEVHTWWCAKGVLES